MVAVKGRCQTKVVNACPRIYGRASTPVALATTWVNEG